MITGTVTITPNLIQNILFFGFAGVLIFSAFLVITLTHPVKSVLCLVLCFFAAAGLWLLLTAEFLALILILVYVGAVMTLFLFIVMTLNINMDQLKQPYLKYYLPAGVLITALITGLLIFALHHSGAAVPGGDNNINIKNNINTTLLGQVLYTQYVLPFEIAGVILLTAMIAAISLTLFVPVTRKQQNIEAQIKVNKQDRLRLVK